MYVLLCHYITEKTYIEYSQKWKIKHIQRFLIDFIKIDNVKLSI